MEGRKDRVRTKLEAIKYCWGTNGRAGFAGNKYRESIRNRS